MSLLKLWFIRNPVLVSYSMCMRQGSSDLSGSQSALACLCVCARAQLGLREFNIAPKNSDNIYISVRIGDADSVVYCSAKFAHHCLLSYFKFPMLCLSPIFFERREASLPELHDFPIFPRIFCLMLQSCISQLVDWYSRDICCCDTFI
jgi:hypothetical protein